MQHKRHGNSREGGKHPFVQDVKQFGDDGTVVLITCGDGPGDNIGQAVGSRLASPPASSGVSKG